MPRVTPCLGQAPLKQEGDCSALLQLKLSLLAAVGYGARFVKT